MPTIHLTDDELGFWLEVMRKARAFIRNYSPAIWDSIETKLQEHDHGNG